MPVVNYHSANGRLIGETTSGVRTDYMSDALGSVTGTLNAGQAVVNTYRYKPYGEILAKTGSAADPAFMWKGTTQSRRTGLTFSDQYNRARHYGTRQGQWTTVDPLWPRERAFNYVLGNPVTWIDPSGMTLVKIYIRSFIHKDEDIHRGVTIPGRTGVWLPSGPPPLAYIKGDHRDHFVAGTSRIAYRIAFDSCQIGSLSQGNVVTQARSDATNALFWGVSPGPLPIPTLVELSAIGDPVKDLAIISNKCDPLTGSAATTLVGGYSGNNPLILLSPPILFAFHMILNRDSNGYVSFAMFGSHTAYPWHKAEVEIGDVHKRLYKYSATVGNLPWGLLQSVHFGFNSGGPGERCCCK